MAESKPSPPMSRRLTAYISVDGAAKAMDVYMQVLRTPRSGIDEVNFLSGTA